MDRYGQIKTDAKKQPESLQEKQSVYKNILAIGIVAGTTFALLGGLWGIRFFSPSSDKGCEVLESPNLSLPVHCLDNSLSATIFNLYNRYQADSIFKEASAISLDAMMGHINNKSFQCLVNEKSKPYFSEAFEQANAFHYIKDVYEECKADDHAEFLSSDMIRDMLAVMYRKGIGVNADEIAALNLFRRKLDYLMKKEAIILKS